MTTACAAALNAGCDMNSGGYGDGAYRRQHPPHRPMQNMSGYGYEYLGDAVDSGMVTLWAPEFGGQTMGSELVRDWPSQSGVF